MCTGSCVARSDSRKGGGGGSSTSVSSVELPLHFDHGELKPPVIYPNLVQLPQESREDLWCCSGEQWIWGAGLRLLQEGGCLSMDGNETS